MIANRLARALDAQIRRLALALGRARRGDARGVHRARVASRRLRELLPVVAGRNPPKALRGIRRDVRRVTKALGSLRELDVTLALLEEAGVRHGWPPAVVNGFRHRLGVARRDQHARLPDTLLRIPLRTLLRNLRRMTSDVALGDPSSYGVTLDARRRARAAALARSLRSLGTSYVPDRLHEVRIAAKKLRYVLEAARSVQLAAVARDIRGLEALQELLGQLHDLQVLQNRLRLARRDAATSRELQGQFRRMGADLEGDCQALHALVLARVPACRELAKRIKKL